MPTDNKRILEIIGPSSALNNGQAGIDSSGNWVWKDNGGTEHSTDDLSGGITWNVISSDTTGSLDNGYYITGAYTLTMPPVISAGVIEVAVPNTATASAYLDPGIYKIDGSTDIYEVKPGSCLKFLAVHPAVGWMYVGKGDTQIQNLDVDQIEATEVVTGANMVPGMEPVDLSYWDVADSTITRQTIDDRDCLQGESTGASTPMIIYQFDPLTVGVYVRITGWVKCSVATMRPRVRDGSSGFDWYGDYSDEWQYFDFWGTTASAALQLRSDGTYAIGETIAYSDVQIYTQRTVPTTSQKLLQGATRNGAIDSDDLTEWSKSDSGDTLTASTIEASTTSGDHDATYAYTFEDGYYKLGVRLKKQDKDFCRLHINDGTTDNYANIDLTTMSEGTSSTGVTTVFRDTNDDGTLVEFDVLCEAGTGTIEIQPTDSDGTTAFAGTSGTVSLEASEIQIDKSRVVDNVGYVLAEGTAVASVQTFNVVDDLQAKYAIGALKRADGGGWEIPVEGVEYIARVQNSSFGTTYTQVVKKTVTGGSSLAFLTISGATELIPAGSRFSYRRSSDGEWYDSTLGTSTLAFQLSTASNNFVYYNAGFDRVYGELDYRKSV